MQDTIRQTRPKQNGKYLTLVLQMILLCLIIGIYGQNHRISQLDKFIPISSLRRNQYLTVHLYVFFS